MKTQTLVMACGIAATLLAAGAPPATAQGVVPVAGPAGGQYTAEFDITADVWRLFPLGGSTTELRSVDDCRAPQAPPAGLWVVTRAADGTPVLLAPSATDLPAGHPGRIRLTACGDGLQGPEPVLGVPESLLDWLADHSGAVLVR